MKDENESARYRKITNGKTSEKNDYDLNFMGKKKMIAITQNHLKFHVRGPMKTLTTSNQQKVLEYDNYFLCYRKTTRSLESKHGLRTYWPINFDSLQETKSEPMQTKRTSRCIPIQIVAFCLGNFLFKFSQRFLFALTL